MRLPLVVRCLLLVVAAAVAGLHAGPAAADGTVYRAHGCGRYIFVSTPSGYSMLIGDGTDTVKKGDTLHGDVERIGNPLLSDTKSGRALFPTVAETHMSRAEVTRRIAIHCPSPLGDQIVSGYVTRATGCGNKIFVDTPQGYAVLERLAGGIVADGDTVTGNFNRAGRATVRDVQSNTQLIVFVADIWLAKSAVNRKIATACRH